MDEQAQARARWTQVLTLVLLVAASGGATNAAAQPATTTSADAQLAAAQALFDRQQIEAAATAFREANDAAGGRCGQCLLGLGKALQRLGRLDSAIAATRAAVAALAGGPLQGRAYCQLGDQLLLLELPPAASTEAEQMYSSALRAGAAYRAEALSGIAEARLQLARYPQAIAAAQDSLALSRTGEAAGRARSTICRAKHGGNLPSRDPASGESAPLAPRLGDDRPVNDDRLVNVAPALRVGGRVSKPVKVYAPPPVYTEEARKQRLQGVVIVEAIIDQEGCVNQDHILKGLPQGLGRAALAAVEKWVFEPAFLDGQPVKVYYTLTINFQVD
jgi:TonB family protein